MDSNYLYLPCIKVEVPGCSIKGIAPFKDNIPPYDGLANTSKKDQYPIYQTHSLSGRLLYINGIPTGLKWPSSENAYHAQKIIYFKENLDPRDPRVRVVDEMLLAIAQAPQNHNIFLPKNQNNTNDLDTYEGIVNHFLSRLGFQRKIDFDKACLADYHPVHNPYSGINVSTGLPHSYDYMKYVIQLKFDQNPKLKEMAKNFARMGIMPVEVSQWDDTWASGKNGSGQNLLGIAILEAGMKFLRSEETIDAIIINPLQDYKRLQSSNFKLLEYGSLRKYVNTKPNTNNAYENLPDKISFLQKKPLIWRPLSAHIPQKWYEVDSYLEKFFEHLQPKDIILEDSNRITLQFPNPQSKLMRITDYFGRPDEFLGSYDINDKTVSLDYNALNVILKQFGIILAINDFMNVVEFIKKINPINSLLLKMNASAVTVNQNGYLFKFSSSKKDSQVFKELVANVGRVDELNGEAIISLSGRDMLRLLKKINFDTPLHELNQFFSKENNEDFNLVIGYIVAESSSVQRVLDATGAMGVRLIKNYFIDEPDSKGICLQFGNKKSLEAFCNKISSFGLDYEINKQDKIYFTKEVAQDLFSKLGIGVHGRANNHSMVESLIFDCDYYILTETSNWIRDVNKNWDNEHPGSAVKRILDVIGATDLNVSASGIAFRFASDTIAQNCIIANGCGVRIGTDVFIKTEEAQPLFDKMGIGVHGRRHPRPTLKALEFEIAEDALKYPSRKKLYKK